MWAGNAVVGRLVRDDIPPFTLNFLRWVIAFAILLPLGAWVLRRAGGMWPHWRRFALLGLLGVGLYNTLQYLALQTSTPLNVTLVASSMPLWMLALGALFFDARVSRQQLLGAVFSIAGVAVVLARGDWTAAAGAAPGDRRRVHAGRHLLLGQLQLAAVAPRRTRCDPQRLGGLPAGAGDAGPDVVGRVHGRRMGAHRCAHPLERVACWPPCCSSPSARRCWPTAAGAWVCSGPARRWRVSSPT